MDANNTGFKMRNDKGNAFIIFVRYTASTGDHKMAFYFFFFFLHFVQHLQFQVKRMRSQIRVLILSCSRSWWRNKSSDKETKQSVTAVPTLNQLIQLGSWLLCDAVNRKQQMALLMINCHVNLDQLTSSAAGKAPPHCWSDWLNLALDTWFRLVQHKEET